MYRRGVRLWCTPGARSFVYFLRWYHGVLASRGTPASIQALPLPLTNCILQVIDTRKAKWLFQGHAEQMNQRPRWLVSQGRVLSTAQKISTSPSRTRSRWQRATAWEPNIKVQTPSDQSLGHVEGKLLSTYICLSSPDTGPGASQTLFQLSLAAQAYHPSYSQAHRLPGQHSEILP